MKDNGDSYTELIHHFNDLEDSYTENNVYNSTKEDNNTPLLMEYMGLTKAIIRDVDVNENDIILIASNKHSEYTFKISTTGEYNEDNEFVRFLDYYNISIFNPSNLIGTEIKIRKNKKGWNLYIPDSNTNINKVKYNFDKLARCFGYQQLCIDRKYPGEIYIGMIILLSVSLSISTIIYSLYDYITINQTSMFVYLILFMIIPFISSIMYRVKLIHNASDIL